MNCHRTTTKHGEVTLATHQPTNMIQSDLVEFNTHSFVIKIWLEVTPTETKKPSWRGHITHIPSGERRYVTNLFCIFTFIIRYLKTMGIKFGRFWWIKDWIASRNFPINDFEGEASFVASSSKTQEIKSN